MLTVIFGDHGPARREFYNRYRPGHDDIRSVPWFLLFVQGQPNPIVPALDLDHVKKLEQRRNFCWEFPETFMGPREQIRIAEALWKLHSDGHGVMIVTHSYLILKWLGISAEFLGPILDKPIPVTFVCCEGNEVREAPQALEFLGACEMSKVQLELYDREIELEWNTPKSTPTKEK